MGGFLSELIFRITGDPAPLKEALDKSTADVSAATAQITAQMAGEAQKQVAVVNSTQEAMRKTIAQSAKEQGASLEQATQIYKQLGLNGTQAAQEIAAAFGRTSTVIQQASSSAKSELQKLTEAAAQAQEKLAAMKANPELVLSLGAAKTEMNALNQAAQGVGTQGGTSIRSLFPALTDLRQITRLAMGAFAVGFLVTEFDRLVKGIQNAADALGGYDALLKQIVTDAEKANLAILGETTASNKQIYEAIKGIADQKQRALVADQQQIALLESHKKDLDALVTKDSQRRDIKLELNALEAQFATKQMNAAEIAALTDRTLQLQNKAKQQGIDLTVTDLEAEKNLEEVIKKRDAVENAIYGKKIQELNKQDAVLKQHTASAKDFAAEIERQNQLLREQTELTKAEGAGPETAAIMGAERQIAAEEKVLAEARKALSQHKITREQMEATEKAYADFVVSVNDALALKLEDIESKRDEKLTAQRERLMKEESDFLFKMDLSIIKIEEHETEAVLKEMDKRAAGRLKEIQGIRQEAIETDRKVQQIIADIDKQTLRQMFGYDSMRTAGATAIVQLERELQSIQRREQAVEKAVATARQEASALIQDAQNKRRLAAITDDLTQKTILLTRAKQEETQATSLQTQADEAETDAKKREMLANVEAVASAAASLLQTLGMRKQAAYVEMVMQTAAGFASLAMHDWWAAAQHFLSAAEYGIIAGQTSNASGTGGSAGGGSSAASSAGISAITSTASTVAASPVLAPGAASAQAAALASQAPAPIIIHLNMQGTYYGGQRGIDEFAKASAVAIAKHLSNAVVTHDVKLISSHTVNPVPVSRGRS